MTPTLILFLIIFLEGYVVLSTELLAIRLLIPFAGSGTDTISIIIAAVLMPLAFGYYAGGRFKTRHEGVHNTTVRKRLLFNLTVAACFLTIGLSYEFLSRAMNGLHIIGFWYDRVLLTTLYSLVFLVYPVYLMGQTVPLISNFFPRARLPVMAGKILFFSTLGSFMGAVFCTLILMTYLGVSTTAVITVGCLAVLVFMLSKKKLTKETLIVLGCLVVSAFLNSSFVLEKRHIVADNSYHTIAVSEFGEVRVMRINNNLSTGLQKDTGEAYFGYMRRMDKMYIDPIIWRPNEPPRDILIIGAGGFSIGLTDERNNYTFVDLDKDMLEIAEEHFLKRKLTPNKKFVPMPARAFLYQNEQKYDLILLDLFRGPSKTPEHLATREFFQQIKDALKPGGIMAGNYVVSPNFRDPFTVRLDNTIRAVFGNINRYVMDDYNGWTQKSVSANVVYSYYNDPNASTEIYTDDKNSAVLDKPSAIR